MTIEAPLSLHRESVLPEWIDYNGHMNVAYYTMISDHAMDAFMDYIGIGQSYLKRENKSAFAIDMRIAYLRELTVDSPVLVKTQLFGFDEKRFQLAHYVEHAEQGWRAASSEWVGIHVDLDTRKSAPFPASVLDKFAQIMAAHASLPRPAELARGLGLAKANE